jgi:ABC-2 type transport system ATP-binding protein
MPTDADRNIALRLDGLRRTFGDLLAVDGLTLEVRRGEVFGLLGPNGAGKTTTIRMICGLLRPDAGEVLIEGLSLERDPRGCRRRIGLCPQELVVWESLTCLEQLVFTGRLYDLEPALALVHDPALIVLDEPQAGLDPQSRVLVREYIRSLAEDRTVLLTTHDMEEADRLSDRVAIIDHGRLLVFDRPERLKGTVGEGDVLEISVAGADPAALERLLAEEAGGPEALTLRGERLRTVGRQVHLRLAGLLERLGRHDLPVGEVTIRPPTLEDVFIALTGRGLRE